MKNFLRLTNYFVLILTVLVWVQSANLVFSQTGVPPPPPIPVAAAQNFWLLEVPPWKSWFGDAAMSFSHLNTSPSWDYAGTALSVDTNAPAFLQLPMIEDDGGWTNITLDSGTLEVWCQANWTSMADGGAGPGSWATMWDIGEYTHDASVGAWLLAIDPSGSNLVWVAQSGGSNQMLWTPIDFDAGDFHQVVATWSATNACLYVDGALATNSGPILYQPSALVCSNDGFCVGSLCASGTNVGTHQFQGQLQWLVSYGYPLGADEVSANFANLSGYISWFGYSVPGNGLAASGGGSYANDSGPPSLPDGGDWGTNSDGGSPQFTNSYQTYSDSNFWLEPLPFGTNAYNSNPNAVTMILHATTNTSSYQLLTSPSLANAAWTPRQIFVGASGQNWTPVTFAVSTNSTLFFQAINYSQDSTDSGLPDWWKIQYGLDPNATSSSSNGVSDAYADPAGDGWSNLQKFQNGWNPFTFYTPPAPSVTVTPLPNDNGVVVSWDAELSPVASYTIYRDGQFLATVPATQTSYQDNAVSVSPYSLPEYQVQANYPGGGSFLSLPVQPINLSMAVDTVLIRGQSGQYYLAAPNIPNTVTNLRMFAFPYSSEYPSLLFDIYSQPMTNFNSSPGSAYLDFPPGSFTNGLAPVPQSFLPYYNSFQLSCVPMGSNGIYGNFTSTTSGLFQYSPAGSNWYNSELDSLETEINGFGGNLIPFLDGSQQLRQNLVFQLESADEEYALELSVEAVPGSGSSVYPIEGQSDIFFLPTYAWANFHMRYGNSLAWVNEFKPFEDNYFYRNLVVDSTSDLDPSGSMLSGIYFYGGNRLPPPPPYNIGYNIQIPNDFPFVFPGYAYALNGTTNPPAPLLSTSAQTIYSAWPDEGNIGVSYTTNGNGKYLSLASGQHNLFGLPIQSVSEYYSDGTFLYSQTLTPGQVVDDPAAQSNYTSYFYAQVAAPRLGTVGYFFGVDDRDYLPGDTGFTPMTGTTAPIIATPGVPLLIGAWAEESVDRSTNTPGFLEQYFDTSYSMSISNGQTTNQLGVLSEYGEFFPTDPGLAVLVTKSNFDGATGSVEVPVIGLYADRNHDGVIDTSFGGPDFCSPSRPFQFWVNDDNDYGDTGGDDVPGEPASFGLIPNGSSGAVNGTRDLIDFFPVYVNIESLLQSTNNNIVGLTLRLSQADSALNFMLTSLTTNNLLQYLTDTNYALILSDAPVTRITSTGVVLGLDFLNTINLGNGGVILVEASAATTAPLVLDIMTNGYILAEAQLPLNITGVEQMFRHKNLTPAVLGQIDGPIDRLTPADVPNAPDDNGTNFVFVHGYNVNSYQARGWQAETFKRMYWSGSHARFYGVTWVGAESQGTLPTSIGNIPLPDITPNYHTNVANAFLTAPYLKAFINDLGGTSVVAAHSLGNMVVLSALNDYAANIQTYFMVDAAVATEAIDASTFPNNQMIVSTWSDYTNTLYAVNWHNLFTNTDYRSKLAWPGRLSSFNNAGVYNFYSSGEEVLRDWELDPPTNILSSVGHIIDDYLVSETPVASYVWVWQEKAKGLAPNNVLLGSDHGGWKFNTNYNIGTNLLSPTQAALLTTNQLQTNAFFDFGSLDFPNDYQIEGSAGDAYAMQYNNRMLGDAIPALSFATGANHVNRLAPQNQPDQNIDMQAVCENNWPAGSGTPVRVGAPAAGEWHHSDCREVAYTYTYLLFTNIVTLGGLK